jgi:hypothetical protein
MPRRDLNLDVDHPDKVSRILRNARDEFNIAASELDSSWQDEAAGRPWEKIALILDAAASKIDKAIK